MDIEIYYLSSVEIAYLQSLYSTTDIPLDQHRVYSLLPVQLYYGDNIFTTDYRFPHIARIKLRSPFIAYEPISCHDDLMKTLIQSLRNTIFSNIHPKYTDIDIKLVIN